MGGGGAGGGGGAPREGGQGHRGVPVPEPHVNLVECSNLMIFTCSDFLRTDHCLPLYVKK